MFFGLDISSKIACVQSVPRNISVEMFLECNDLVICVIY